MYIFGYGSLIWKVDFPYQERHPCYVKGFVRRFWQSSSDHRGTPEKPGIVLTLIPYDIYKEYYKKDDFFKSEEDDLVWGVVYKIRDEDIDAVISHLDHREKGGYEQFTTKCYLKNLQVVDATIYVASHLNVGFLGPASKETIARTIAISYGPSGLNKHYLLGLRNCLRLFKESNDQHLEILGDLVEEYFLDSGLNEEEFRFGELQEESLLALKVILYSNETN
ncbi:hypothetical protein HK099_004301 [Clydaea vesicula]|uniref:glutathione-specific gamma-glutamylcyclotransferase n=1 Tax=Clydaea vesicula TaxID=447962 RepID=A0AAD5U889_9FUNG|nr:hypothetical protein HK099_004301 [Clydaea vesicula]KAJ3396717.1 hypothetical protein HDU92_002083 [Lobulomyces angularis]